MGFNKKTVRDIPVDGQTVLVRAGYDIPVDNGFIVDDLWIRDSLPTINYLLERGCKVIVVSHYGTPTMRDIDHSLEPAAARLAQLLHRDIRFVSEVIGDRVLQAIKKSPNNSVVVLENLRFHPGEEADDAEFAQNLVRSTGARYHIQDNFAITHKKYASTDAITAFLPSVAGLALEKDYLTILKVMQLTGAKNDLDLPGVEVLLDVGR